MIFVAVKVILLYQWLRRENRERKNSDNNLKLWNY